jgi:hypothetical protein
MWALLEKRTRCIHTDRAMTFGARKETNRDARSSVHVAIRSIYQDRGVTLEAITTSTLEGGLRHNGWV